MNAIIKVLHLNYFVWIVLIKLTNLNNLKVFLIYYKMKIVAQSIDTKVYACLWME